MALRYLMTAAANPGPEITEEVVMAKNRHNLRLYPDEPLLIPAFHGMVSALSGPLADLMTPEAKLVELGGYLTNPKAKAQGFHTDVGQIDAPQVAPYYSAMLYLTDVEEDGGRFQVVPCTHALSPLRSLVWELFNKSAEDMSADRRAEYERELREKGIETHSLVRTVAAEAGDIVIYDSTVVHQGSANQSQRTRGTLYMTFLGQGENPPGSTFAIHSDLLEPPRGPLTLSSISKQLWPNPLLQRVFKS